MPPPPLPPMTLPITSTTSSVSSTITSNGASVTSNQISGDSANTNYPLGHYRSSSSTIVNDGDSLHNQTTSSHYDDNKWKILEGLKDGQRFDVKPAKFTGFMLKRRKRPLKGWHKRYFNLDNGILTYAKNASDLAKGKLHGSIDVGLSVISAKSSSRRIDIDSESIYHLKVKKLEFFNQWLNALNSHRLARQHEINQQNNVIVNTLNQFESSNADKPEKAVIFDLGGSTDNVTSEIQEKLVKLSSLLRFIEFQNNQSTVTDLEGFKYKKPRRRFYLRRKKHINPLSKADSEIIGTGIKDNRDNLSINSSKLPSSMSHGSLADETSSTASGAFGDFNDDLLANLLTGDKSVAKMKAMSDFIQLANDGLLY